MILRASLRQKKNFSAVASVHDLPMPSHDAVIGSDTLSSVSLNYRWRRYISLALETAFNQSVLNMSDSDFDDFIQVFDALMVDIDD